jgi:hypothetical protein
MKIGKMDSINRRIDANGTWVPYRYKCSYVKQLSNSNKICLLIDNYLTFFVVVFSYYSSNNNLN